MDLMHVGLGEQWPIFEDTLSVFGRDATNRGHELSGFYAGRPFKRRLAY